MFFKGGWNHQLDREFWYEKNLWRLGVGTFSWNAELLGKISERDGMQTSKTNYGSLVSFSLGFTPPVN